MSREQPRSVSIRPACRLPDRIIVIGDLHLGEGAEHHRGQASGEQFFRDRDFQIWLGRLTRRAQRRGWSLELALNGDTFDFLRILRLPETQPDLLRWRRLLAAAGLRHTHKALGSRERLFGLGTDEPACVWKLAVIAAAHRPVFRALATFCRAGHTLTLIRGNHDPEWAWSGVRRAFRQLLRRAGSGKLRPGQVSFRSGILRRANVHVEHGHRVDWVTYAERDFIGRAPVHLRLAFGSLVTRYVLNVLERRIPPLRSVPPSERLAEMLRRHPWRMLPSLATNIVRAIPLIGLHAWRSCFRRMLHWWPARVSMTAGATFIVVTPHAPPVGTRFMIAVALGLALPIAAFLMHHIAAQMNSDALAARVRRHARQAARRLRAPVRGAPRYLVFGHTHHREARQWKGEHRPVIYLNPGDWGPTADSASRSDEVQPCFIWLARHGRIYVWHRLLSLDAVTR